jgi:hypothetical protein
MPYERARAHADLARLSRGEERASHAARAATLFEEMGCSDDLARIRALD